MINIGLRNQLKKIKDNWLILLILLVVIFFIFGGDAFSGVLSQSRYLPQAGYDYESQGIKSLSIGESGRGYYPQQTKDFAPEIADRKIIKTASMSNAVERGNFQSAQATLKSIIKASNSFILNENVNKNGIDKKSYYTGRYQIRVEDSKYDSVINQLKQIGEVTSFVEYANDVTGTQANLQIEIQTERARLARYQLLYQEATSVSEKLQVEDRVFNQERTVKYLEDSLNNIDQRITYTSISFSLIEKQSEYLNIVFIKFSTLVKRLVSSINSLLTLIVVLLPYAIAVGIIWFVVRYIRRRQG